MKRYYFCRDTEARNAPDAMVLLTGAYRIDQQIENKLRQIADLRKLLCPSSSFPVGDPVCHSRNVTAMQDTVTRILEEEERLNQQIDELVEKKREIEGVLALLPDPFLRLVLEKRYLCFLTWKDVATDLDCSVRLVQEKHNEAVRQVQGILDRHEMMPAG